MLAFSFYPTFGTSLYKRIKQSKFKYFFLLEIFMSTWDVFEKGGVKPMEETKCQQPAFKNAFILSYDVCYIHTPKFLFVLFFMWSMGTDPSSQQSLQDLNWALYGSPQGISTSLKYSWLRWTSRKKYNTVALPILSYWSRTNRYPVLPIIFSWDEISLGNNYQHLSEVLSIQL